MAAVLALFEIIFIYVLSNNFLKFFRAYADKDVVEEILPIILWIYIGLCALMVLSAALGMAFVGKAPGAKSFWTGLSRVISVIGMILTFGFMILLKTTIDDGDVYMGPVCQFLTQAGISHAVAFVALFFRRKL